MVGTEAILNNEQGNNIFNQTATKQTHWVFSPHPPSSPNLQAYFNLLISFPIHHLLLPIFLLISPHISPHQLNLIPLPNLLNSSAHPLFMIYFSPLLTIIISPHLLPYFSSSPPIFLLISLHISPHLSPYFHTHTYTHILSLSPLSSYPHHSLPLPTIISVQPTTTTSKSTRIQHRRWNELCTESVYTRTASCYQYKLWLGSSTFFPTTKQMEQEECRIEFTQFQEVKQK